MNLVGEIDTWIKLDFVVRFCQQGAWQLLIKNGTPQARLLQQGGGIVIYQDGVDWPVFSGPVDMIQRYWTTVQHTGPGSLYIGGKCDNTVLYGYLALPGAVVTPAGSVPMPIDKQWLGSDSRPIAGPAGQAVWAEADMALGSRALQDRAQPRVSVGPNPGPIGKPVNQAVRYDNLGTLIEGWYKDKEFGYRMAWSPSSRKVELKVFKPRDLSKEVRLSPELGNLREYVWTLSAPRITRAIVACRGEGKERYVFQRIDAEGERQWGCIREQLVDRRDIPLKTGPAGQPELVLKKNSDGTEDVGTNPEGGEWTPELAKAKEKLAGLQKARADAQKRYDEATKPEEKQKAAAEVSAAQARLLPAVLEVQSATEGAKRFMLAHYLKAVEDAAAAALKEGEKNGNFQVYPIDTPQCAFGKDYFVGDKVTVAVDGEEYADVIREVNITVENGGQTETVTPKVGQQGEGDPLNLYKTVWEMREKLRKLEARM
ncbi:Gp37-like protein [Streptomyces luteireticuli]